MGKHAHRKGRRVPRVYEVVLTEDLRVRHPRCDSLATVTDISFATGFITAICPRCDKYIYLQFESSEFDAVASAAAH